MISDETVDRVRDAADIVQIIGEHVTLRRTGSDYRGPCPFHQGTHRNFAVVPKKGIADAEHQQWGAGGAASAHARSPCRAGSCTR